jgi:hypothetical protein
MSSQRVTRVGYSLSTISIAAILPLVWLTLEPETPSWSGSAPVPPPKISYCT